MITLDHEAGNAPSGQVWSLLSGLPSRLRAAQGLAFFEAYFDDSSSDIGDERLFIAGYLNTAHNWSYFSDAWDECLREPPAIEYFKMAEARALQGQFRGVTPKDRDAKLRRLSFIVRHFAPLSFEISVSRRAYREHLQDFAPRGLNPHFYCVFGMMSGVSRFLNSRGISTPVRFYFDTQDGVDTDIALFFDHMRSVQPRGVEKIMSGPPIFESDKRLMPLQAADFLAWHVRREHEGGDIDASLFDRLRDEHVVARLGDEVLKSWSEDFGDLPGIQSMQSKGEWQRLRAAVVEAREQGFRPPYGSRWKNFKGGSRDFLKRYKKQLIRWLWR